MPRIMPFVVPSFLTLVVGGSFALPAYQWAVGVPALACQVVWLTRYVRRERGLRIEQEQRHDRRRQLLSTLAHEVRTPLTVIRSSSTILLDEERSGALSDKQRRFVGSIYGNSQRLEALTENILAGLKIESWSDSLRLRPVDLRKEVIAVARSMEPALATRDQRIHYMFPSILSRAQADPQWIGQVLVNLIHNAGKYTDADGTIDIRVTENEHYLVLSVSDNGSGLPDRRPDVFEPFVQGDPRGSASSEGTGLGLAIVKRVIALHGGEVYVASRQDGGTTVSVTLKKAKSHE
ncbi:MAG TPA: HAMP domain-containing sensor histidine kinase [Alkalispirochaeta sp.]|nr:HAMP domain-containing sensor histidine kinase [Alkalispirochaeta sp.]